MKKIVTIFLLMLSLTAQADKWYIATAVNGGDDADGDGSITSPWLTLKHACDTITGANFVGDTIIVGVGTFTETAQSALAVGVSIYGAGETSIISSTYVGSLTGGTIQLESATEGTSGNQSISYIKMEGNVTGLVGIVVYRRSNVEIHDVTIQNFVQEGIKYHGGSGYGDEPDTYSTGNKIYDSYFYSTDDGHGAIHLNGQDGIKIYGNTFSSTQRVLGHDINHIDLVEGYNKNIEIYNNTSTQPQLMYDTNGTSFMYNAHIESWDGKGGNKIYNNTFIGGHIGVDVGGTANVKGSSDYSFDIYGNTFKWVTSEEYQNTTFGGIVFEGGVEYLIIRNNYFENIPVGVNSSILQSPRIHEYIWIYNNVFKNTGFTTSGYNFCIRINQGVVDAITRDVYILNNTIDAGAYQRMGVALESNGAMYRIHIKNNIIKDIVSYGAIGYWDDAGTIDTVNIQNNCLYNNVDTIYYRNAKSVGAETISNNITTDPTFVSASDLHLQSTSPCRDAGLDVSAITGGTDFHGASLYGAAYDIGAFEYGLNRMFLIGTTLPTINYKIPLIDH